MRPLLTSMVATMQLLLLLLLLVPFSSAVISLLRRQLPPVAIVIDDSSTINVNLTALNLPKSGKFEIAIIFNTTVPNCLLWWYEDKQQSAALYFSNGALIIFVDYASSTGEKSQRVSISIDQTFGVTSFAAGRPIELTIAVDDRLMDVYIGSIRLRTITFKKGVKLIGDGDVKIGQAEGIVALSRQGVGNFAGMLYSMAIGLTGAAEVDIVDFILERRGGVSVNGEISTAVISSSGAVEQGFSLGSFDKPLPGMVKTGARFLGSNAVARLSAHRGERYYWDYDIEMQTRTVLDFTFVTYDPIGVMFFKGAQIHSLSFFCIEMLDGYIFFKASFGRTDDYLMVKMCNGSKVNDGNRHHINVTIERKWEELLINGVKQMSDRYLTLYMSCDRVHSQQLHRMYAETLDGYLYIGGVDSINRLPWRVWSRRNFNGVFEFVRFNKLYVDFTTIFGQQSTGVIVNRYTMDNWCSSLDPAVDVCSQKAGGKCWVDRPPITEGLGYFCNCARLAASAIDCTNDFPVFRSGVDRGAWVVNLRPTWSTHCDDILVSFRHGGAEEDDDDMLTMRSGFVTDGDYNDWDKRWQNMSTKGPTMFAVINERKDKHIVVRLDDGQLEFEVMVTDGEEINEFISRSSETRYDDGQWHVVRIRRCGEWLRIEVDDVQLFEHYYSNTNFLMEISQILVGCLPNATTAELCDPRTIFTGQLRNLIVNRLDVLHSIVRYRRRGYQTVSVVAVYMAYRLDMTILVAPIFTSPSMIGGPDSGPGGGRVNQSAISNATDVKTIGLLGYSQSLIELNTTHLHDGEAEILALSFVLRTDVPDGLIFYIRSGLHLDDRNASFVTLEMTQGRLRFACELFGDYVIHMVNGSERTQFTSVRIAKVIEVNLADGRDHRIVFSLFRRNMNLQIDSIDASVYFDETDEDAVEKYLVALPDDLLRGRIFLGGFDSLSAWEQARSLGHTSIYDRYLRGCFSDLVIQAVPITYSYLKRYYIENNRKWIIVPDCLNGLYMTCDTLACANQASCVQVPGANAQCTCLNTGFRGYYCDQEPQYGYYCGRAGLKAGSYIHDSYVKRPPEIGDNDTLVFGVVTWYTSGTLVRIEHQSSPKQIYLEVGLYNGALVIEYRNNLIGFNDTVYSPLYVKLNQGNYQVVRLDRNGDTLNVLLRTAADDGERWSTKRRMRGLEMLGSGKYRITLCGRPKLTISNYFNGIIAGLVWNNVDIFELGRTANRREMRGDVLMVEKPFVLMPWPCYSIFSSTPCPAVSTPPVIPATLPPVDETEDEYYVDRTIKGGSGIALGMISPDVGAVAQVSSQEVISPEAVIALSVISAIIMAASALWWLIANVHAGFVYVPPPAAPEALGAVPPPAAAGGEPDIGTENSTNVRALPPPSSPGDDIPTTGNPAVRAAPPSLPVPAAVAQSGAYMQYAQFGGVQYYPVPIPVPMPMPMPMMVPMPVMPVPYVCHMPSQALTLSAAPQYQSAASETSFTTVEQQIPSSRMALEYRPAASENVKMQFGGTETVTETRHNSVQRLAASTRSLNETFNFEIPEEYKVNCFTMTGDSQFVIVGSSSGAPSVWSLNTGQMIRAFEDAADGISAADELQLACRDELLVGQIAFLSGSTVVSEAPLGLRRLQIWRVQDGSVMPMSSYLYCSASCLLRNRQYVVAGAVNATEGRLNACLWNLIANEPTAQLNAALGSKLRGESLEVKHIKVSTDDDCCVIALSGDVAAESTEDTTFYVWNFYDAAAANGSQMRPLRFSAKPDCYTMLPDRLCVVGTHSGELFIWSTQTMNITDQFRIGLKTVVHNALRAIEASLDYAFVATGDARGNVKLWQFREGATSGEAPGLIHALDAAHAGSVTSFSFAVDNELLISGSIDGSIRLWKIGDATQLCWFESNMAIIQVRISISKRAIVALGECGDNRKLAMLRIVRNVVTRKRASQLIDSPLLSERSDS